MSRYRDADLRGVPVVTKSGKKLGKLLAFVIDAGHHEVAQYVVTRSSLLSAILPSELLINKSQVISLDNETMVVDDSLLAELAAARAIAEQASSAPQGASSMEG